MASKLLIHNDIMEKMRCKQCNNHLSIFPIYLLDKEKAAVCGRCQVIKTDFIVRDEAYENLAQFVLFPCAHKQSGCMETLNPVDLQEHEPICQFKKFDCPSKHYTKCAWQGPCKSLEEHFKDKHVAQLIKDGTFEINFLNSQKENLLLPMDDLLFIVTKEIDSRKNMFWCVVKNIIDDSNNKFNYRLILETPNRNYSHKFPIKRTTSSTEENLTMVTADFIHEHLDDPETIVARIEIHKATKAMVEKEEVKDSKTEYPSVNYDILAELECPVCMDYMLPPIYQCIDGHSICNICKLKVPQCPLCKKEIQSTQNYVLEKITNLLVYPCKFHRTGCKVTAKSNIIKTHEQTCVFGPNNCPLEGFEKCDWKDNISEVTAHVETKHKNFILKSEKIDIPWTNSKDLIEKCYILQNCANLFKLQFKYDNEKFYWCVQFVGPAEKSGAYKYEVDFVDNSLNNLRHFLRNRCVALMGKDDCYAKSENYSVMYLEQLKPFIVNKFSFKIRVYKD